MRHVSIFPCLLSFPKPSAWVVGGRTPDLLFVSSAVFKAARSTLGPEDLWIPICFLFRAQVQRQWLQCSESQVELQMFFMVQVICTNNLGGCYGSRSVEAPFVSFPFEILCASVYIYNIYNIYIAVSFVQACVKLSLWRSMFCPVSLLRNLHPQWAIDHQHPLGAAVWEHIPSV